MLPEQLEKILKLVKKTGDRVIMYNAGLPQDSFVLMDIDSYLSMVNQGEISPKIQEKTPELVEKSPRLENLTEEDLTDKINREILMWKNQENESYIGDDNRPKKAWSIPPQVKEKAQEIE